MTASDEEIEARHEQTLMRCQQALREVGLHWLGRPLDEGVREAVEEIKRRRQVHLIDVCPGEVKEIAHMDWDEAWLGKHKGTHSKS